MESFSLGPIEKYKLACDLNSKAVSKMQERLGVGKYIRTEKEKLRLRTARIGIKTSEEVKLKLREKKLKYKGVPLSEEHRKKIGDKRRGHKHTEEVKRKLSLLKKGKTSPLKGRKSKVPPHLHPSWKGGITPVYAKIRRSIEYQEWRKKVFERDKYTCIWCGDNKGGNLQADHIKPFAYFPELRFELSNGRTLCEPCHKKTDTWGKKSVKLYANINK